MGTDKDYSVVNMKWYLDFLFIGAFLFVIGLAGRREDPGASSTFFILGSLGLSFAAICLAVMLYRLWKFVIDAQKNKDYIAQKLGFPDYERCLEYPLFVIHSNGHVVMCGHDFKEHHIIGDFTSCWRA
jgi:hypothetical protein